MALSAAERQRRYRRRHPVKVRAAKRKREATAVGKAARRRRRAAQPERYDAYSVAWRAQRPGYAAEVARRWRQENPERSAALDRAKALRRTAGRTVPDVEYGRILLGDPCCYCGAPTEHLDHIVASCRGGPNGWENMTAACARCNTTKGRKSLLTFLSVGAVG